ncbi:MAG: hypothetical protein WCG48_03795 [Candidatus Berkelbacteria bacterium]
MAIIEPNIDNLFDVMKRIARILGHRIPDISGYEENVEVVKNLYRWIQKESIIGKETKGWSQINRLDVYSEKVVEIAFAAIRAALDFDRAQHPNAENSFSRAIKALEEVEKELNNVNSQKKQA